ncbi:MAG: DUF2235 domain-containing protein [Paracoccaceae bacterium]|nr:DUF2235 domain-containing protein [Paracoccaceae bacterium]
MPKNIVICADGTGNEIKENLSNVLKLYRILEKNGQQVCFYDPGVGTISNSDAWSRLKHKAKGVFGLATGYGLDANVLDSYRFLVRNYRDGDQIYLFGFSRGAYTVRVLAGFLNLVGLVQPEQEHLTSCALTAYKQASNQDDFRIAWRVQRVLETRRVTIHFMGCWDTVGTVIIPRPDRLYLIPSLETLPYTKTNPCVRAFRHAIAIDERRRMFRLSTWTEPQKFKTNPFVKDEDAAEQDIEQVWFAGVHSDIGGGYPETQSGLAKIPLDWMIDEAEKHGLICHESRRRRYVQGDNPRNSTRVYVAPNPEGMLHDSITGAWPVLEWLPKRATRIEWHERKAALGVYLPRSEPRPIPPDATIHPSVGERKRSRISPTYNPVNLPPGPPL